MTIIDRYIAREFGKLFGLILMSFVAIFLIVDFFGKIRFFMSNSATLVQVTSHFFFEIPMIVSQTTPAAVLLTALATFGMLARTNEMVAMKANGISLYRAARPVLVIGAVICLFNFVVSEIIAPKTTAKAEYIRTIEVTKKENLPAFKQNQVWYRSKNGIYNFKVFDPASNTLQGITIYYLDHGFRLQKRVDAERAEWRDGKWILHRLLITRFEEGTFPRLEWIPQADGDIPEKPADFKMVEIDIEQMGFFSLRRYVEKLQSEGFDATRYLADLYGKMAFSFISLILVVIGISFSMTGVRSGGMTRNIGAGLVIGFSYWMVHAFFLSLGRSGTIPPLLSAWVANAIFGTAALVLFFKIRT